jgi:hypothetical protein
MSDALRQELRADPPLAFSALADADADRLAAMLRDAREQQHRALAQAIDDGLGFVPRLLRGAVRKASF